MKNQIFAYFLLIISLLSSCNRKKEISEPNNLPEKNLVLLWEHSLSNPNEIYESLDPILFGDFIISSYYRPFTDSSEVVFALNKNTGEQNWTWDDYIRDGTQYIDGVDRIHIKEDLLIACSSQDNYAINMNDGQTYWATNIEDGNPRTTTFEDLLFHTITYGSAPYGDSTKIIVRPVGQGDWKDVFQVNKTEQFEVNFEPPAVYKNSDGDTVLIFQNRQIDIPNFDERVDLYCYNVSLDSILWYHEEFTISGSSNVRAPKIEGDLVFFDGKWDFSCLDIHTGEVIWNHNFYHTHLTSNFLIYNNLIIVNLDNGDLIAINKHNGTQEWVNTGLSGCCTELRVYNDRIYFGNDKLYIVDPSNGNLIYKFASPHPGGSFMTAIAVDVPNKRMYTTDRIFMYCFELPE